MQIEELLRVLALIEDDTEGGGREHDLVLVDILQVPAGVEAAETVRVLQLQLTLRLLIHLVLQILRWHARSHLTLEGLNGHRLVAITGILDLKHTSFVLNRCSRCLFGFFLWSFKLRRSSNII